jgi:ketosteroid isomerase-like protein
MRVILLLLLLTTVVQAEEVHPAWKTLAEQDEAWNRGDLESFLDGYVKTDDLLFTSSGKITRGYEAIRKRYMERYGTDKSTMGKLSFEPVQLAPLGDDNLLVVGKWHLERQGQPNLDGIFTLVMVNTKEGWKILHDHTSVTDK